MPAPATSPKKSFTSSPAHAAMRVSAQSPNTCASRRRARPRALDVVVEIGLEKPLVLLRRHQLDDGLHAWQRHIEGATPLVVVEAASHVSGAAWRRAAATARRGEAPVDLVELSDSLVELEHVSEPGPARRRRQVRQVGRADAPKRVCERRHEQQRRPRCRRQSEDDGRERRHLGRNSRAFCARNCCPARQASARARGRARGAMGPPHAAARCVVRCALSGCWRRAEAGRALRGGAWTCASGRAPRPDVARSRPVAAGARRGAAMSARPRDPLALLFACPAPQAAVARLCALFATQHATCV